MMLRLICAAAALGVLLANCEAHAERFRGVIEDLDGASAAPLSIERVHKAARAELESALAEAQALLRERPYDVAAQLQRCRVLEEFAANYEYAEFATDVGEQAQACADTLTERHPDHPETVLWRMQRSFGEEQLQRGEELLRSPLREAWTPGQLARLHATLAQTAELSEQPDKALTHALRALELDEEADVRMIAASRLLARGDRARALELLRSEIDGADPENVWALSRRMTLLAELGAESRVLELYQRLAATENYNHAEAARALRSVRAVALARREVEKAVELGQYSTEDEKERFRFELEHGGPEDALAAYNAWRDAGWTQDPLAINRAALAARDVSLPWRARFARASWLSARGNRCGDRRGRASRRRALPRTRDPRSSRRAVSAAGLAAERRMVCVVRVRARLGAQPLLCWSGRRH